MTPRPPSAAPDPPAAVYGQVEPVLVDAGGVPLSGLLARPSGTPRAALVALHGAGMCSGYFHSPAHPRSSLLVRAAQRGYVALALDRPGYGHSAGAWPAGLSLADQIATVREATRRFTERHPFGSGVVVLGHSLGGQLALGMAADAGPELIGVDVSGIGNEWAADPRLVTGRATHRLHWGPLSLYPPGTFRSMATQLVSPPAYEAEEVLRWPQTFRELASRVRVPVRLTFAEHELWWRCDADAVRAMAGALGSSRVVTETLPDAGHNISLGWTSRIYHDKALTWFDDCLAAVA